MNKQKGFSLLQCAIYLLFFGFLGVTGVKIGPAYVENQAILKSIQLLAEEDNLAKKTTRQARDKILKTVTMNNLRALKKKELVVEKNKNNMTIEVKYDARMDWFANIDALISFEDEIILDNSEDD